MNTGHDVEHAAHCIREGKLVAFPTETVYGLGADALNPQAVAHIFELKERPSFDPLIVHIAHLDQMSTLVAEADPRVFRIAKKFWPGPLTIVMPKGPLVPDIVTAGLPTVGIRMPDNTLALELIQVSGRPIAAPSANKFGRISPTTAAHVKKQLPDVDYILDGGKTTVGIESTIIRLTPAGFQILRNGFITREDLETVLPFDDTPVVSDIAAPGMLKSHYSPRKKLLIADEATLATDRSRTGLISFTGEHDVGFAKVIRVSRTHDLKEYAVNVFEAMHTFEDDDTIEVILAEPVPDSGIGKAIMDRLRKAEFSWRAQQDARA
jgi:L-threonylcarbamoyladenylate synthase